MAYGCMTAAFHGFRSAKAERSILLTALTVDVDIKNRSALAERKTMRIGRIVAKCKGKHVPASFFHS